MAFVLEPSRPLDGWLVEVQGWLDRSPGFFAGKPILLNCRDVVESRDELVDLVAQLGTLGVRVMGLEGADAAWLDGTLPPIIGGGRGAGMIEVLPQTAAKAAPVAAEPAEPVVATVPPVPRARQIEAATGGAEGRDPLAGMPIATAAAQPAGLIVDHGLRSGQTLVHPGDVTIVGAVASGAEVIAGGSIHVYGALRGRAVAGAGGNGRARIFARRFEAELIAIDGHYRTAEDLGPAPVGRTVHVLVEDGSLRTDILE